MIAAGGYDQTVPAADAYAISLAVRRLLQAAREMQAIAARQLGLRITDVQAMDLVTACGGELSPAELADRLGIRTASASALIDRLVDAGHLERSRSAAPAGVGRGRTRLNATEHARLEIRETLREVNDGFRELGTELTSEEAAVVLRFLDRATGILRSYASGAADHQPDHDGRPART
jgi:DNA-binding MarR family transcriptional regulator